MPLWESLEFESLSPQCSIFTYSTVDYFSGSQPWRMARYFGIRCNLEELKHCYSCNWVWGSCHERAIAEVIFFPEGCRRGQSFCKCQWMGCDYRFKVRRLGTNGRPSWPPSMPGIEGRSDGRPLAPKRRRQFPKSKRWSSNYKYKTNLK